MALMSEPVTSLGMTPASSWARFACPARKPRSAAPRLTAQRPPPHAGPAPGGGGDARGCRRDRYIWLEQGRDVNPSSAVMAAIAKALQCTPTEARHLFVLAGLPPGEARRRCAARDQRRHASPAGYPDAETCQYSETEF